MSGLRHVCLWLACGLLGIPSTAHATSVVDRAAGEIEAARTGMPVDPEAALGNAGRSMQMLSRVRQTPKSRRLLATACWLQAEASLRIGRTPQASLFITRALSFMRGAEHDGTLAGNILLTHGGIAAANGQPAVSLSDYQNAYRVFQKVGDLRNQSISLLLIASIYGDAENNIASIRYLKEAYEKYHFDPKTNIAIFNNEGNFYKSMGDYRSASEYYKAAVNQGIRSKNVNIPPLVYANLGEVQLKLHNANAARQAMTAARKLLTSASTDDLRVRLAMLDALMRFQSGRTQQAAVIATAAFSKVDIGRTTIAYRDPHLAAYRIFKAANEPARALAQLEAVKRLDDQATKLATSTSAALMGARFNFANQELKISQLKADELRRSVAFEQANARTQHRILLATATATAVIILLLAFGLVTIRRSRDQVRAANDDLATANRALSEALAVKTEFLAMTSHEIRTPLNGILGMTQVLLRDEALGVDVRDRIGVVARAGAAMKAMVDDILDVAKMETGKLILESVPFDLVDTLRDAAALWTEQARAKGIAFDAAFDQAPRTIVGDPSRVRQIVFNLLSNALKFTEKGRIVLDVEASGDRLRIIVADTGVGIPADKQGLVFESFRQADASTTRRFGGTGLGLSICRSLAQAMGGDIALDSEMGVGSRFTVTLPLIVADARPGCEALPANADGGVLVVDRNPIMRGMWRTLLGPHAPALAFAASVQEAVDCLSGGGVARLVIDDATIRDGGTALRALETLATAAHASGARSWLLWPVAAEVEREELLATGVDHIIAKPVASAAVVAALFGANADAPPASSLAAAAA